MVIFTLRIDQWKMLLDKLDEVIEISKANLDVQKAILKALTGPNRIATIRFEGAQTNMSVKIPVGTANEKFYLTLMDAAGNYLSALDRGEVVAVVSDDPATVDFAIDTISVQDPDPAAPPTVTSGDVIVKNPPAQPNVPINVTANFTLSDGTLDASVSDTAEITNQGGRKAGILFGTATPLTSSSANVAVAGAKAAIPPTAAQKAAVQS